MFWGVSIHIHKWAFITWTWACQNPRDSDTCECWRLIHGGMVSPSPGSGPDGDKQSIFSSKTACVESNSHNFPLPGDCSGDRSLEILPRSAHHPLLQLYVRNMLSFRAADTSLSATPGFLCVSVLSWFLICLTQANLKVIQVDANVFGRAKVEMGRLKEHRRIDNTDKHAPGDEG